MAAPVLIALGAAGVALLAAGSKEKAQASAPQATNATPTQQTTGGDNGGATNPSHSDTNAEIPNQPTVGSDPNGIKVQNAFGDNSVGASPTDVGASVAASGAAAAAVAADPWSDPGPSVTTSSGTLTSSQAVQVITGAGQATIRETGKAFAALGSSLGAIW